MKNNPPPFYPRVIQLTSLCVFVAIFCFSIYSITEGGFTVYRFMIPVLLAISLIGMKLAAPLLPWIQALYAVLVIFFIHFVAEHIPLLFLFADTIIEIACVLGFGAYWVKKGYIPKESNRWI